MCCVFRWRNESSAVRDSGIGSRVCFVSSFACFLPPGAAVNSNSTKKIDGLSHESHMTYDSSLIILFMFCRIKIIVFIPWSFHICGCPCSVVARVITLSDSRTTSHSPNCWRDDSDRRSSWARFQWGHFRWDPRRQSTRGSLLPARICREWP